jgi:hypothetical protein
MARNKISQYSTTAGSNTDVGSIEIEGENVVANFDNALRELMKHMADMNAGTSSIQDTFTLADPVDDTKKVRIDAGGVTAGQTRVMAAPDKDGVIAVAADVLPVGSVSVINALDTATYSHAICSDPGKEGLYKWDGSYDYQRRNADEDEHRCFSPHTDATNGAWVRVNLSEKETLAINNALRRTHQRWPQPQDLLNTTFLTSPFYGRQVNFNSKSEDLSDSHYAASATVESETKNWNGVQLQRVTMSAFSHGILDTRSADYDLEDGVLYIASMFASAPRPVLDDNNMEAPNSFMWMQAYSDAGTLGHGAKLLFPTPRRVWSIVRGGTTSGNTQVVGDPTVAWASQTQGTQELAWLRSNNGLKSSSVPEVWMGGLQLERAPNQSEKVGVTVLGTSIDVMSASGGDGKSNFTTGRGWPRWLEGLLCSPFFCGSVGGETSADIDSRFNTDIAPLREHSKYLILCANVNDFISGFNSTTYRTNWLSIYNKAITAGWNEDEIIWMTVQPRSIFNYSSGLSDVTAENAYIKETYRNVIDRSEAMADAIDAGLLPEDYETDGIHQNTEAHRALAFMIYNKYRHFFRFDNTPGPYQKTIQDNSGVQTLVEPSGLNIFKGSEVSSADLSNARESNIGTSPVIEFTATLTSDGTYQLPIPHYHGDETPQDDEWQLQRIFNNTSGGFNIRIQYYKRPGGTLSTVGSSIGPIPNGECWTIMTNGTDAVRVL